jgi:patatin-like phospholipase/acyl hydrolase
MHLHSWTKPVFHGLHGEEPNEQAIRVLAIDGGGVRGIIPAVVLGELERRAGRHLSELFDVIGGTSTGAILAMGLVVPGADGHPRCPATIAADVYEERVPSIFRRPRFSAVHQLLHEKYEAAGIEAALQDYFGDALLSQAVGHVVVPAYDLVRRDVHVFDSLVAQKDPQEDILMRLAVRGATAAPTFFDPLAVGPPEVAVRRVFMDGGVFANNPGMLTFVTVAHHYPDRDVVMISLGTGALDSAHQLDTCQDWGVAQWARPLLRIVGDGINQSIDLELRKLLGEQRYLRLQPTLPKDTEEMDNADPRNLKVLRALGERVIEEHDAEIDRFCALLSR